MPPRTPSSRRIVQTETPHSEIAPLRTTFLPCEGCGKKDQPTAMIETLEEHPTTGEPTVSFIRLCAKCHR